jgi:hypothetical protein
VSPSEPEPACATCGATYGPRALIGDRWTCCAHLPRTGDRRQIERTKEVNK